jgi:membrane protein implicated in regulation of membrane protease activity
VDVVTEGEFVRAGAPVEVLRLEGNHLVVRAVEERKGEG